MLETAYPGLPNALVATRLLDGDYRVRSPRQWGVRPPGRQSGAAAAHDDARRPSREKAEWQAKRVTAGQQILERADALRPTLEASFRDRIVGIHAEAEAIAGWCTGRMPAASTWTCAWTA